MAPRNNNNNPWWQRALLALLFTALVRTAAAACAPGYAARADEDGSRHCYALFNNAAAALSRALAHDACAADAAGGALAALGSAAERLFVAGHMAAAQTAWIDGQYDAASGQWLLADGVTPAALFWDAASPDNYGAAGEGCMELVAESALVNDLDCALPRAYVCEYVDTAPIAAPPSLIVGDYERNPAVFLVGESGADALSYSVNMEPGATLAFSIDRPLPDGLSFNPTTGVVSGAPAATAAGELAETYTVTAAYNGASGAQSVSVALQLAVFGDAMCQMLGDHAHEPASADWSRHGFLDRRSLKCVCESGFRSNSTATQRNCLASVDEAQCPRPAVQPDTSAAVALLDPTRTAISSNRLRLGVAAPLAWNRMLRDIELGPREDLPGYSGPGARQCHYQSEHWNKVATALGAEPDAPCNDIHEGVIPWGVLTAPAAQGGCGLAPLATTNVGGDAVYRYEGQLRAYVDDVIGEIRGQPIYRHTQSLMKFHVDAPAQVEVSVGDVNVAAPIAVLASITRQVYAFNQTGDEVGVGVVHVYTSVQWPFELRATGLSDASGAYPVQAARNPDMFGVHSAGAPLPGAPFTECDASDGSVCWQTWALEYFPQDQRCTLGSEPRLQFDIVCRGPASLCPLDGSEEARVDLVVQSEDFCADLELETGLTGTMSTHEDYAAASGAFGDAKIAFLDGQQIFVQVQTQSPDIPLATTSLHRVELVYQNADGSLGAAVGTLYDEDACAGLAGVCADGLAANYVGLAELDAAADRAGFRFDVATGAGSLFEQVGFDEIQAVTIRALVDVTYRNGPTARAAVVIRVEDGVSRSELSSGFALDYAAAGGNESSEAPEGGAGGAGGAFPMLFAIVAVGAGVLALTLLVILVVVAKRRRRRRRGEAGEEQTRARSDSACSTTPLNVAGAAAASAAPINAGDQVPAAPAPAPAIAADTAVAMV